ncbi:MAG: CheR family methyltransferase [Gordonibacter pamelaeae]
MRITGIDVSGPASRGRGGQCTNLRRAWRKCPLAGCRPISRATTATIAVVDPSAVACRSPGRTSATPRRCERRYDLILCRNVIIYFDEPTRERVLDTLHRHLALSSYLILGHAEIVRDRKRFAYRGDSIYQKRSEETHS